MVRHVVMWKFKEFAQGRTKDANIDLVKSMLEELKPKIPSILAMDFRKNEGTESAMFDAILTVDFESLEDVAAYRKNEDHKAVSSYVALVREQRASIDFTINNGGKQ